MVYDNSSVISLLLYYIITALQIDNAFINIIQDNRVKGNFDVCITFTYRKCVYMYYNFG